MDSFPARMYASKWGGNRQDWGEGIPWGWGAGAQGTLPITSLPPRPQLSESDSLGL